MAVLVAAWLGGSSAHAAPCEHATTPVELVELEARSRSAIEADDAGGHHRAMDEVARRVRCLEGPIPQGIWARLLVNEAMVRLSEQRVWEPILATAFAVDPGVTDVPDFLRDAFDGRAPDSAGPVPEGVTVWVDGHLATAIPAPEGLHVVQARTDDGWSSVLLRDTEVPAALLQPPETPPEPRAAAVPWVSFHGVAGGGTWTQRVEAPGTFLADTREILRTLGVGSLGHVHSPEGLGLGLAWDATLAWTSYAGSPLPAGTGVVGAHLGQRWSVVIGAAASLSRGNTAERASLHPSVEPHVGARARLGRVDLAAGGGGLPRSGHALIRAGLHGPTDTTWRVGLALDGVRNDRVVQEGSGRAVGLGWLGLQLTAGVLLGGDR